MKLDVRDGILAVTLVVLNLLAGCGGADSGPATVPVAGTVTYQGKPVADATITLEPADPNAGVPTCQTFTDADGRFEMVTLLPGGKSKAGMVPGQYRATVTKPDLQTAASTLAKPKNLLPDKYASSTSSGLQATITADGDRNLEFKLK